MNAIVKLVEGVVAKVGHYDSAAPDRHVKFTSTVVLMGAVTFTASSAVALLYQRGLIHPLLPAGIRTSVVNLTARVAELTEPPKAAQMAGFLEAKTHMRRTYSLTAATFITAFLGTQTFFGAPHVPLAIAAAGAGIPTVILAFLPRRFFHRKQRLALLAAVGFGAGYVFGPVNYIACDSMKHVGVAVFSTCAGFCFSASLTRGCVSYFVTAHCLSSSLAIIGSNILMRMYEPCPPEPSSALPVAAVQEKLSDVGCVLTQAIATIAATQGIRFSVDTAEGAAASRAVPLSREAAATDVNMVLTMQAIGNIALAALHSIPSILRANSPNWSLTAFLSGEAQPAPGAKRRRWNAELRNTAAVEAALEGSESPDDDQGPDDIFEALVIFSSVVYAVWAVFERTCEKALRAVTSRTAGKVDDSSVGSVRAFLRRQEAIRRSSRLLASATFFLAYLRMVRYLQKDADPSRKLDIARKIFHRYSPLQIIV